MAGRNLKRCEAHDLSYDPAIQSGCTLCRNSLNPKPTLANMEVSGKDVAMVIIMGLWVVGVLSGGYFGIQRMKASVSERRVKDPAAPMPVAPGAASAAIELPPPRSPAEVPMLRRAGVDRFGYPRDAVDKVGILSLLNAGEFAALTRHIEGFQGEFEADFHKEEWMSQAMEAFDSADPRVGQRIEEWMRASPASFAPVLARAQHRIAIGWYYRGGQFSNKTERDRLTKFRETLKTAEPDVARALELRPKLVAAYQTRLWLDTCAGKKIGEARKVLDAALTVCPACFRIRSKYEVAISPRWGGSLVEMEDFAAESQKHAGENPRLKVLLGYADDERCRSYRDQSNFSVALDACNHAVAAGDFHRFYALRSEVLTKLERPAEALEAIDHALEEAPQEDDYVLERALLRLKAGRLEEGVADLRTAAWLDPVSESVRYDVEHGVKTLVYAGYQRSQAGDDSGAVKAYDLALSLAPGNEEALKWKVIAGARLIGSDTVGQLEAASRADPGNFDTFKRLDDELVKTREFGRIVAHWDRYLAIKPGDARAYLERGGALLHQGETARAIADLDRACSAGLESGCRGVQFARARAQQAPAQ